MLNVNIKSNKIEQEERNKLVNEFRLNTNQEYFAMDIPKFFFGSWASLWRLVTNNSTTDIDNPGMIVNIFISNGSKWFNTVMEIIHFGYHVVNPLFAPTYLLPLSMLNSVIEGADLDTKKTVKWKDIGYVTIWELLVLKYDKINFEAVSDYRKFFEDNKKMIDKMFIDNGVCKKIPRRKLTMGEVGDLKLFKPDKIIKDYEEAYQYAKSKTAGTKNEKEWDKLYIDLGKYFKSIANKLDNAILE